MNEKKRPVPMSAAEKLIIEEQEQTRRRIGWPGKQFVVYVLIINVDGELFVEEVHPGSDRTSRSVDWDQVSRHKIRFF